MISKMTSHASRIPSWVNPLRILQRREEAISLAVALNRDVTDSLSQDGPDYAQSVSDIRRKSSATPAPNQGGRRGDRASLSLLHSLRDIAVAIATFSKSL